MQKKTEPELAAVREVIRLEREAGRKLSCVCYKAENALGTILISHGFTETAEKYVECAYYFLKMKLHVFCVEHCGHGDSYRLTEDPSLVHIDRWERYVEDLIFAGQSAKNRYPDLPLYVYGHSMGGGIAAAAAAKRPELFEKMILSSPMVRPLTTPVPWMAAKNLARVFCRAGREEAYVTGQKPYHGPERYEDSASLSRERFDYYQSKRSENPKYQMNAPSYGWLYQAARLNRYLMTKGWKAIRIPVLIFQAGQERFVSNREMERFVKKIKTHANVRLVSMEHAKHEIYNSQNKVLREYWKRISLFLFPDGEMETGWRTVCKKNRKKVIVWTMLAGSLICAAEVFFLLIRPTAPVNGQWNVSGTTFVSDVCIYSNPLSSYVAPDGDSGCTYMFGENSFEIVYRSSGEQKVIPVKSWKWHAFPYTDAEWEDLYIPAADAVSNISKQYGEIRYLPLSEEFFLMRVDKELWMVELTSDQQMGIFLWSIYRLIPEGAMVR